MSVQHANIGVVKKDLQLYYNREFPKSFRGQATTNIAYATNNFLNSNSNWWVNSGNAVFNDNDTSIDKPIILNVDTSNLRIFSSTVTAVGNQQLGSSIIPISGSTQYSMSIYYWFSGGSMQAPPYVRANINNNELAYFGYNGDTNYLNWPRRTWIRLTATFTTQANETGVYMSSYTGDTAGEKLAYFGYQIEQKAYVTPLVLGSRTANTVAGGGGLLDISGNNYNIDLTSSAIAFDSGGYYFNGNAAGGITIPVANSILDTLSNITHTYEVWFKLLGTPPGASDGYFFGRQGYHEGFAHFKSTPTTFGALTWYNDNTNTGWLYYAGSLNVWYHAAYVVNVEASTRELYINGVLNSNGTLTKQLKQYVSGPSYYYHLGSANPEYASNIIVSSAKAYNKALTAAEVSQNFNATRKTYGI
jgi:hypothetical protein